VTTFFSSLLRNQKTEITPWRLPQEKYDLRNKMFTSLGINVFLLSHPDYWKLTSLV